MTEIGGNDDSSVEAYGVSDMIEISNMVVVTGTEKGKDLLVKRQGGVKDEAAL